MDLQVSKRMSEGVPVVDVNGRLVFGEETKILRNFVKDLLEVSGQSVVLNLSHLAYVDSGGIGTLVGLYTSAKAAGGDIKLACPNARVQHVLEITRLFPVLGVFATEDKAIAELRRRSGAA
jgi:anti-sigma B factor antagonist